MLKLVKTNVSQFKFFRCTRILFEKYEEKKLFQLLLSFLMDKVSKVSLQDICRWFSYENSLSLQNISILFKLLLKQTSQLSARCEYSMFNNKTTQILTFKSCKWVFFCESRLTSLCLQTYHHKHQQYK